MDSRGLVFAINAMLWLVFLFLSSVLLFFLPFSFLFVLVLLSSRCTVNLRFKGEEGIARQLAWSGIVEPWTAAVFRSGVASQCYARRAICILTVINIICWHESNGWWLVASMHSETSCALGLHGYMILQVPVYDFSPCTVQMCALHTCKILQTCTFTDGHQRNNWWWWWWWWWW